MEKIKPEPKGFWNDMDWGTDHYSDLVNKYPDKWVAIVDKKVVASGDGVIEVENEAMNKTGKPNERIPVIFVECGNHVY